jgi:hypothetical protein
LQSWAWQLHETVKNYVHSLSSHCEHLPTHADQMQSAVINSFWSRQGIPCPRVHPHHCMPCLCRTSTLFELMSSTLRQLARPPFKKRKSNTEYRVGRSPQCIPHCRVWIIHMILGDFRKWILNDVPQPAEFSLLSLSLCNST